MANTLIPGIKFQNNTLSGGSLTTGLVSYYKLEDVTDFYGSNNLTNNGSVAFVAGKVSNAASFNGSSNYLSLGSAILGGTNCSIAGWVYLPSTSEKGIYIKNGNAASPNESGYGLAVGNSSSADNPGNNALLILSRVAWINFGSFGSSGWHHFAATNDGTTWRGYIDGTLSGTTSTSVAVSPSGGTLMGNGIENGGNYWWDGKVDETGFWSKALIAQEITDLYNGGSGQTMVGNVVDTISAIDNAPTISISALPARTFSVSDIDIDSDNIIINEPIYLFNVSDIDSDTDSITTKIPTLGNLNVSETETSLDIPTIAVLKLGAISVSDSDLETDTQILQIPIDPIVVSDVDINSDAITVRVPCLGHVNTSDTDPDSDVVTNIALNPLQLVVSETAYANDLAFFEEFSFFTLDEIDVDQDFVSILIPTLFVSVSDVELETDIVGTMSGTEYISTSDVELESESVTTRNPILGAISVSDDDLDTDSITVKIPNVGSLSISDTELEQESVQLELVNYLDVIDIEIEGENVSIQVHTPGTFTVYDTEAENDFVLVLIPQLGNLTLRDSVIGTDSVLLNTPSLGAINVLDSENGTDFVDLEIIEEGLFVSDTETLSEFVSIGIRGTLQISRTIQNTYNTPSIILTP